MLHFTPTFTTRDTSKNVRNFVRANKDTFHTLLQKLLPYFIAGSLIDAMFNGYFFPDGKNAIPVGQIVSFYFLMTLIITWHRVVIHGPDTFVPMDIFKPTRKELAFIGMGIFLAVALLVVVVPYILFLAYLKNAAALIVSLFLLIILGSYAFLRTSFYFPAKAIGNDLTLKQAWRLGKGYAWKLFAANFRATYRVLLLVFLYMLIAQVFIFFLLTPLFQGLRLPPVYLQTLIDFPVHAYFNPLMYALGVTVLSNYYQYARQAQAVSGGVL